MAILNVSAPVASCSFPRPAEIPTERRQGHESLRPCSLIPTGKVSQFVEMIMKKKKKEKKCHWRGEKGKNYAKKKVSTRKRRMRRGREQKFEKLEYVEFIRFTEYITIFRETVPIVRGSSQGGDSWSIQRQSHGIHSRLACKSRLEKPSFSLVVPPRIIRWSIISHREDNFKPFQPSFFSIENSQIFWSISTCDFVFILQILIFSLYAKISSILYYIEEEAMVILAIDSCSNCVSKLVSEDSRTGLLLPTGINQRRIFKDPE